jgi:indolepyruvate ferredoxin oxidoreductase
MIPAFRLLARMKGVRGTAFDLFGRTAERRMERGLIAQFEADMAQLFVTFAPARLSLAREWAEVPLMVRGFGPVKEANAAKAAARRAEIMVEWADPAPALAAE